MKQIIILEAKSAEGGAISVRAVFWFPVIAGAEIALPNISQSAWAGASADEILALQKGSVVEETKTLAFPGSVTETQIETALEGFYADRATFFAAVPFKGSLYGKVFDGTTWTK